MAHVFVESGGPLSDSYLEQLLRRDEFWAVAAFVGQEIIGGITAHVLPMTRTESVDTVNTGYWNRTASERFQDRARRESIAKKDRVKTYKDAPPLLSPASSANL
jgi:hypothetical protein